MFSYTIQSLQTHRFLYTDEHEQSGSKVQMVTKLNDNLDKTVVTASRPLEGDVIACSILGKAGLFVSVASEVAGEYLIWSKDEFIWGAKIVEGNYEFIVPGKDYYWFTNKEIVSNLIIQTRDLTTEKDILFRIFAD